MQERNPWPPDNEFAAGMRASRPNLVPSLRDSGDFFSPYPALTCSAKLCRAYGAQTFGTRREIRATDYCDFGDHDAASADSLNFFSFSA